MKKVLLRLVIFLIILIIFLVGGFFAYNYYLNNKNADNKKVFLEYAFNNNFDKIFDYSAEEKIFERLESEYYNSKTNIDFSNTFANENNFEIDKLTIESDSKFDKVNREINLRFNYSNNELFSLNILGNPKYIAIKNNDVLNNYIGVTNEKLGNVLYKINSDFENPMKNYENISKDFQISTKEKSERNFSKYLMYLDNNTNNSDYKDEGEIVIEQNDTKILTHRYTLEIPKNKFFTIYDNITNKMLSDDSIYNLIINSNLDNITKTADFESEVDYNNIVTKEAQEEIYSMRKQNDSEADAQNSVDNNQENNNFDSTKISDSVFLSKILGLSNKFNSVITELNKQKLQYNSIRYVFAIYTNFSIDCSKEDIKNDFDEIFTNIKKYLVDNIDDDVKIEVFIADGKTVRTTYYLGKKLELTFDFQTQSANKEMCNISAVQKNGDSYDGYSIKLNKNKTSAIDNNIIEIGKIEASKIVSKFELKLNIEGSIKSNKLENSLNILYSNSEGKFSTNISNTLSFSNQEVEKINSKNTILLDNLKDDELYYLINRLNSRIDGVYEEKISKLNLINANTSDTILKGNKTETIVENVAEKEKMIDILVEKISNEMGKAELSGKKYTLQDLQNLVIDGYELSVSVSNDLAIIKINGYTFKIDKDFNLSE